MRNLCKKAIRLVLLAVIVALFVATPVLAYTYSAQVSITESTGTSYTMLPVSWAQNNDWLADNGYMTATALDTRVQTVGGLNKPWMVTEDKTLTAIPVGASSQTNLIFATGESAATSMDIITGYGGYVTVADAAALELGNNFSLDYDGYVNTLETDNVYGKTGAYSLYTDGAGNIVGSIANSISSASTAATYNLYYPGQLSRMGQRYNSFPATTVTRIGFYLTENGNPTGTLYAIMRKVSDDSIIGTFGTLDAATVTAGNNWYYFDTPVTNLAAQDVRFTLETANADSSNYVRGYHSAAGGAISGNGCYYAAGWTDFGVADDTSILIDYDLLTVTAVLSSGEYDIQLAADATDLTLTIDSVEEDSIALGGASVLDNANDLVIGSASTPYINSFELTVSGTRQILYQPIDIISGTTLPDREGAAQDGTITFGANPAGVTTTLGGMVSAAQSISLGTADSSTGDLLPSAGGSDWNTEPAVTGALLTNPLRPIVTAVSDNTTLTERQVWVLFGIISVVFVTVLVGANVRGHHLITGIAASVIIVLMIVWTVFNLWALVVVIMAIFGGLISERSPSL